MIKTILVPFGGGDSDSTVFQSAVQIGRLFKAHLDVYHVGISAGEAAIVTRHAEYAMGAGLRSLLGELQAEGEDRSATARLHFDAFCRKNDVPQVHGPEEVVNSISARWIEDDGFAARRLLNRSRSHDLLIVCRPQVNNGLRQDIVEHIALNCGRPVLLLPVSGALSSPGTVLICWKNTAECARATGAAMPFLQSAKRVIVVTVQEPGFDEGSFADFIDQLVWHGIEPDVVSLAPNGDTSAALFATAKRVGADLMVMGLFGRSPMREIVFGGVSSAVLSSAPSAVLMMH